MTGGYTLGVSMVRIVIILLAVADLAWWRGADARMARLPRTRGWNLLRGMFACFMAGE